MSITTSREGRRGCGYRTGGGLYLVSEQGLLPYLVSGGPPRQCGLLPFPTCGGGPSRSWTWINPTALIQDRPPCRPAVETCGECWKACGDRAGLLWIGSGYYKRPEDWTSEAIKMGVSRRVASIPKGFKVGETWVLVAHRECFELGPCFVCGGTGADQGGNLESRSDRCEVCKGKGGLFEAGIFHAFKPDAIEYVVTLEEKALYEDRESLSHSVIRVQEWRKNLPEASRQKLAHLERLERQGIRLVFVERTGETGSLPKMETD